MPTGVGNFVPYYYICLAFLAGILWIDWRMMRTKGGRALLALRENPRVAATLGINVKAYQILGFAVSGVFAGIGGALYAHLNGFVDPSLFDFQMAIVFVLMTVAGGLRNRTGIVISAAFTALLDLLIGRIGPVRCRRAGDLVGWQAVQPHSARCAVLGDGCDPSSSGYQAAAPER